MSVGPGTTGATPRPRNFTRFFATSGFNLLPTSSGGSFNETALQVEKESFFMKPVNPFLGAGDVFKPSVIVLHKIFEEYFE